MQRLRFWRHFEISLQRDATVADYTFIVYAHVYIFTTYTYIPVTNVQILCIPYKIFTQDTPKSIYTMQYNLQKYLL